ncbi:anhydro-N-acetylmuramic acid kinase [Hyphococcus luteus]|uniref:Anhydro-N-acetylmuramic acid kinase n=1 Tax=Hyphococcus luteus TaxID=2058213 RepID=A0A2S7K933_9PROT|nr:anhydro-N-acetylmuramic acid kinase [Marinicaulis flavus]PQA88993.1 anhydro-N-acetylmuramic acid kinase [Marinicaulis flavus]
MSDTLTAIGLMSGTSLDGIDAAILTTDGEDAVAAGPAIHIPYSRDLKIWVRRAIKAALEGRDGAEEIGKAAGEVTYAHVKAVEELLEQAGIRRKDVDVIGFHGQTILHRPSKEPGIAGRTWQLGDGRVLAEETRIDVVNDFRSNDVASGGEGAPFAPVYHRALVASMEEQPPCAVGVVNLGGVSNVTYVPEGAKAIDLVAFDCGPSNGLIDEWIEMKTGEHMDTDGAMALAGTVNEEALRMMLLTPYLRRRPPKSLDRYDFKLDHVKKLSPEDGAATLTAFTAECIQQSEKYLPEPPGGYIICGGGRHNPAMMTALRERLEAEVVTAEDAGWRGDDLEAECFAYLAVRSLKKLPISYPKTTRVPRPMTGGVFHRAPV